MSNAGASHNKAARSATLQRRIRLCGHPYGERRPSMAVIALHHACSHSAGIPIVEVTR